MKIIKYLQVAIESVVAHKMRAILTMLGIIIGVAAVLTTMGIGRGAAANITENIESQGTNLLTINSMRSVNTMTMADVADLSNPEWHPGIEYVAPEYRSSATLIYGETETAAQVSGVMPISQKVRNFDVASGRYFTAEDAENRVAVLGSSLAGDLFDSENPVGLTMRINGEPYQVIGVLEESGGFGGVDQQALVPLSVAQGRLFSAPRYRGELTVSTIYVQVKSQDQIDATELQIESTLRLNHYLQKDDDNDFFIQNQADMLETLSSVSETLTVFLGAIGAVSLLVGGIGIMNIMLVSVTERTREIGLRKAIGAHDSDILLQFLIEALVLCFIGGLIGVGLSFGVGFVLSNIPSFSFTVRIQPDSITLALTFSILSGLIFGIYPAMRATKLDPIEALRSE